MQEEYHKPPAYLRFDRVLMTSIIVILFSKYSTETMILILV